MHIVKSLANLFMQSGNPGDELNQPKASISQRYLVKNVDLYNI